jgi:hypothetical protein
VQLPVRAPYEIPAWVMMPKQEEVANLLVVATLSGTHIGFSSLRLEPQFLVLGGKSVVVLLPPPHTSHLTQHPHCIHPASLPHDTFSPMLHSHPHDAFSLLFDPPPPLPAPAMHHKVTQQG